MSESQPEAESKPASEKRHKASAVEQRPQTPAQAWAALQAGNDRFVSGHPAHPNQSVEYRGELVGGQAPFATFFGCADSRVAAEVIFDQGLGDLFVVRTAGHVLGATALGSLEFGAVVLNIPLIVVLGHDSCGAVKAAMSAHETGTMPPGFMRELVERVTPSVMAAYRAGSSRPDEVEAEHVRHTVKLISERSQLLAQRIASGHVGIVGLTYALAEGRARKVASIGDVE
ncbi:carbonic anhydrase [Kineosphaera limosa]|uniref:carbonic anhydrase n=1 Tax=Kineosphaera limosa NBRC 100340 TaxID=1184609 RepID=K6WA55_9MICO|nr:carbonic anhydrase [Kineosphaera limosa]NYE02387.1 carbonic anhydrase [Kineosphaera limosa]GAB96085.1 putative carbonic anhydrase [Kineosphaera limosa NBRC 100340]